jgi:hypothetical protein
MDECDRRCAEQVDGWQLLRPQLRASTKRAYRFHLPGALIAMVLLARAAFCSCLRRKLFLFVISCEASLGRARHERFVGAVFADCVGAAELSLPEPGFVPHFAFTAKRHGPSSNLSP